SPCPSWGRSSAGGHSPHENSTAADGGPRPCGSLFPFEGTVWANCTLEEVLVLPTFSAAAQARVGITLVLCVVSTASNVAVLWAGLGRQRARRSHARVLLLHLATADLLVASVVMPLDAAWNITLQWLAGDVACRALMFLKLLAMYASSFVTAVISLDRQDAILHPLATVEAWRRNQLLLTASWLLSAGLSVPQLFLFHAVTITGAGQNFTQCTTRGSFSQDWHEAAYNLFGFACLFLLPLLVMVACYSRILREISRRLGSSASSSAELPLRRSRNPIPRARLRMLRLSAAIVGSFVLCWTPYYLLGFWYWFWPAAMARAISPSLAHLLFLFGLLNACLDPLLYGLFVHHRGPKVARRRHFAAPPPSPPTASSRAVMAISLRARRTASAVDAAASPPLPDGGSNSSSG
uniref:Type II GnRH receptor n=1 Tax=Salvator merianae TaxID=96440 RepID=A0A8D0KNI3_SALMN